MGMQPSARVAVSAVLMLCGACEERRTQTAPEDSAAPSPPAAPSGVPPLPPPGLDDPAWATARSVEIRNAAALGCSARWLREQLQISCARRDGGDAPVVGSVKAPGTVHQRARPEAYLLQTQFAPGTEVRATFVWGEDGHELVARWPAGTALPESVGELGPRVNVPNACKQRGFQGHGTFASPCLFPGPSPVTARWTGTYESAAASALPVFELENKTEHALRWLSLVVYYYDASGKQLTKDARGVEIHQTTSLSRTADRALAPNAKERVTAGVPRERAPANAQQIEAEVHGYGWSEPEHYFQGTELGKRERPRAR